MKLCPETNIDCRFQCEHRCLKQDLAKLGYEVIDGTVTKIEKPPAEVLRKERAA